jgi:hypothetical protein
MPQQIEITNVNGVGPYQVKVCDVTNTTCVTITGATYIPPSFTFLTPPPFENVESLLIKIIDSTGCETFQYYSCPTTPTPTPTPTITVTPTPTYLCYCITAQNTTNQNGYFDYTDCNGNLVVNVLIQSGVTYYTCGINPTNEINISTTVGGFCNSNQSCPTPSCTPTPTITPSPSPCVYSEWEIKLGSACTFDLYDCDYNVYDTVTFPISGTYYVCSVYQPTSAGICALPPTIPNVGPCTP